MNKIVTMDDIIPIITEQLKANGTVAFSPKGRSMYPTLVGNRDNVTMKSINRPIRKYDIVLYKRLNGEYVLHRVVGINKDDYTMRGDNQVVNEYGIKETQLIAVVSEYIRDGRKHKCDCLKERMYGMAIARTSKLRRLYYRIRRKVGRIIKKR